jgi:tetratricopeptide (TPR) repeat protein
MKLLKRIFSLGEDENYRKGIDLFNDHEYQRAIEEFQRVVKGKKNRSGLYRNLSRFYSSQAYRNLGTIAFVAGKFGGALKQFREAMVLNSEHVDLNFYVGICLNNMGDFEGAMTAFKTALNADPDHLPTQMKLAVVFHNLKLWDDAVSSYRKILEQKPRYADINYRLGLAYLGEGDPDKAAQAFEAALEVNPNYTDARIKIGMTRALQGKADQAIDHLRSVVQRFEKYADVHYLIALVLENEKRFEDAIDALDQALNVNPSYKDAKIKIASLFVKTGRYEDALNAFKSISEMALEDNNLQIAMEVIQKRIAVEGESPESMEAVLEEVLGDTGTVAGTIEASCCQIDIAPHFTEMISLINLEGNERSVKPITELLIPLFEDYVKKHPTYPDLPHSLGTLYLKLRRFDAAERAFQEAVTLNSNYIKARINLMKTLKINKKFDLALPHGEFVISKGVEYPDVFLGVGEIHYALGRYEEALLNAEKAIEVKPSYAEAYYFSGQVLEKLNKKKHALFAYEQCLTLDAPERIRAFAKEALEKLGALAG